MLAIGGAVGGIIGKQIFDVVKKAAGNDAFVGLVQNIIMAMNTGADDFIAKPFDSSVLIAKIQALLRRAYAFGESVPILEHRGAVLNTGDGTLRYGDREITLSKNVFRRAWSPVSLAPECRSRREATMRCGRQRLRVRRAR